MQRIASKQGGRMFKSPILESMTKTSPMISIIVYGPTIGALLYVARGVYGLEWSTIAFWFLIAIVVWTFAEYTLHRYLFHYVTDAPWTQRFHFLVHGAHHDEPLDQDRLLMPPVPGLILASILFAFFFILFWIAGYAELTWAFFPGFFLGYLLYSFMHYSMHAYKAPKMLKSLWLHHNIHHYQAPNRAYGVSNRFWDRVFGTMPSPQNKQASGNKS